MFLQREIHLRKYVRMTASTFPSHFIYFMPTLVGYESEFFRRPNFCFVTMLRFRPGHRSKEMETFQWMRVKW
jgi:hypothetical protein